MQSKGKYELLRCLGRGGMAECFLARFTGPHGFERDVVVKRVLPHLAKQERFVRRLIEEARLAARLRHPNIAQVFELGDDDGMPFLALEHVDGKDLFDVNARLRARGERMPAPIALSIVRRVLEALACAHDAGVVHRDVSLTNVLVSFDGDVKLIDFGIARAGAGAGLTQPGVLLGKMMYMAPEHILGEELDGRADVYAAGVLLHELLRGDGPRIPGVIDPALPKKLRVLLAEERDARPAAADAAALVDDALTVATSTIATLGDTRRFIRALYADELAHRDAQKDAREATRTAMSAAAPASIASSLLSLVDVDVGEGSQEETTKRLPARVAGSTDDRIADLATRIPPLLTTSDGAPASELHELSSTAFDVMQTTRTVAQTRALSSHRAPAYRLPAAVAAFALAGVVAASGGLFVMWQERSAQPIVAAPVVATPVAPVATAPAAPADVAPVAAAAVAAVAVTAAPVAATPVAAVAPAIAVAEAVPAPPPSAPAAHGRTRSKKLAVPSASARTLVDVEADGSILLSTTPRARAFVDGRDVGMTPLTVSASPGRHALELVTEDGARHAMETFVRAGKSTTLTRRL